MQFSICWCSTYNVQYSFLTCGCSLLVPTIESIRSHNLLNLTFNKLQKFEGMTLNLYLYLRVLNLQT